MAQSRGVRLGEEAGEEDGRGRGVDARPNPSTHPGINSPTKRAPNHHTINELANQPASQPVSHPANQPTSQPTSQPASQPARIEDDNGVSVIIMAAVIMGWCSNVNAPINLWGSASAADLF